MDESTQLLRLAAPWLLVIAGLGTALGLGSAVLRYLEFRQASFFILRQRARRKLGSSLALTTLFAVLTAGLAYSLRFLPAPPQEIMAESTPVPVISPGGRPSATLAPLPTQLAPTPTVTPGVGDPSSPTVPFIPTNTPSSTPTSTPTPSPTPTASLTPSITPTPSKTPTPSPTVPILQAILTPVTPFATASADAEVGELTVSLGVNLGGAPIDPGTEFREGQPVLFVSFEYDNLWNGILWRNIWLRNEGLVAGETRLWEWGSRGRTYFFLRPVGGFLAGDYEVLLMLEDDIVQTVAFTVLSP